MRHLGLAGRAAYGLGDFTVNTGLSALSLIYVTWFLTQEAGLRPALAGLVPLVGRVVDALTDPLMGRLSDAMPIRGERRRPWFLIGAVPFGIFFALLWVMPPGGQVATFAYYTTIYCGVSVCMTIVGVPYVALIPEMALGYDERTQLNAWRNAGAVLGTLAAVAMRPTVAAFGTGPDAWLTTGMLYGLVLTLPWGIVWWVSFERASFAHRRQTQSLSQATRAVFELSSFRWLMAAFLGGRIAMDLAGSMLVLYFTWWIGRSEDFEIAMVFFLLSTVASLPLWLRLSRHVDKRTLYIVGSVFWFAIQVVLYSMGQELGRLAGFGLLALAGIGFAVVDLVPWAMLGDVIDEDDLRSGERREGLFNGLFMMLSKLGGALAVFLALGLLDLAGFEKGGQQSETVRQVIRALGTLAPGLFIAIGVLAMLRYPLSRSRHVEVLRALAARDAERGH